jgi:hypothetical protein
VTRYRLSTEFHSVFRSLGCEQIFAAIDSRQNLHAKVQRPFEYFTEVGGCLTMQLAGEPRRILTELRRELIDGHSILAKFPMYLKGDAMLVPRPRALGVGHFEIEVNLGVFMAPEVTGILENPCWLKPR